MTAVAFGPAPIVSAEDGPRIARVARVCTLRDVRLVDLRLRRATHATAAPSRVDVSGRPELQLDAGGLHELSDGEMKVWIQLSAKTKPKTFEAEAVYEITYELVAKVADDDAAAFARVNSLFNAWPYWRELVHSLTQRMGEPAPAIVPLLRI